MTLSKKLSIYLNQYRSYHKIKSVKSEEIFDVTFNYIELMKENIFKQPIIALRAIKVEMIDINIHYDKYIEELEMYVNALNAIVSKGPKLDEMNLEEASMLEKKRNVLAEFVCLVENSLACITRMLIEHYSESEINKPFLDKFSKYLGPFDWMSKRVERFCNGFVIKGEGGSKTVFFEREIILQARKYIESSEIILALDLLLTNTQDKAVKKDLILLKQQWADFEKRRNLGVLTSESSQVTMNGIVYSILLIIPEI